MLDIAPFIVHMALIVLPGILVIAFGYLIRNQVNIDLPQRDAHVACYKGKRDL